VRTGHHPANAVLLRDAPVSDPDRLVDVYTTSGNNLYSNSSYPDYFDLRDSGTFGSLAAYTAVSITMDANGQPEPLAGQLVSGNYFQVLGVNIPVGRGLTPDDDRLGTPVRVAVISHALWQRVFNADRSLIGQTFVSTATRTRSLVSHHQGSSVRSSESRRTSGFQPRFSPKWIRRQQRCAARAVIRGPSTCAARED
jgi:hypothetical protein